MSDQLITQLEELRRVHRQSEDCWYSCPKSGECCNDNLPDECNCGADEHNAKLDAVIANVRLSDTPREDAMSRADARARKARGVTPQPSDSAATADELDEMFGHYANGNSAGLNNVRWFACRICGACVVDAVLDDAARQLHRRWHRAEGDETLR